MPSKVKITFASSAISDLEEVVAYYDKENVPDVGKRRSGEIIAQIERLADHPLRGRTVPEFNVEHLRKFSPSI